MKIRLEAQESPVADEVGAMTAVVRPILVGTLLSLKEQVVQEAGGHERVKLFMLARLHRPGDGDCGICFEYAVHDAVRRAEPSVLERVEDSLRLCRIPGHTPASILFGAEKTGAVQLIDTDRGLVTSQSRLLAGNRGRPASLARHLGNAAAAFRKKGQESALPRSISGLWKADLFLGHTNRDRWVGTSVKINPEYLEGARGLRIGIVPARQGRGDAPRKDDQRNLVICPLPYDGAFVETFYMGWEIVKAFLAADAQVPREVALPRASARQVARYLADRRAFPVLDVIEALEDLAQPHLLNTAERNADLVLTRAAESEVTSILAPIPAPTER
jgi:hypothetical protein